MIGVSSLHGYLSRPMDRYFRGPTYIVWWSNAKLSGVVLWGRPEPSHLSTIMRALDAELAPGVAAHASLIDARRVSGVDAAAFDTLLRYVDSRREAFNRLLQRQALLRPEGLPGAVIAGFYALLTPSYPVRVFTDLELALDWLEVPSDARLRNELDVLSELSNSCVVDRLRIYLEESLGRVTMVRAANALHVSPRTLQRKLSEAGTSFRAEQNLARVRAAKALLLDASLDLKRIASEVGCASPQNFSSLFKRLEGESPSEWRAQRGMIANKRVRV